MKRDETQARANRVARIAKRNGADLVGFADMRRLKGFFSYTDALTKKLPYGICLAVSLDKWGRYDNSTEDDFAFPFLEHIAKEVKKEIEKMGYAAKVIKPDKRVAHNSPLYWRGEVSHKAAAKIAGLGWTGRSTLLITPEFGPRVCLVTVLTNMELPAGRPMKNKCGSCRMCVISCPRRALKGPIFADHPADVADAVEVKRCGALVNRSWDDGFMCYECMLACPMPKRKRRGKSSGIPS